MPSSRNEALMAGDCGHGQDRLNPRTARPNRSMPEMILWYSAIMLGLEAASVMNARLAQFAMGRLTADETNLMVTEKVGAAFEACSILASGATLMQSWAAYRTHVAANIERLK